MMQPDSQATGSAGGGGGGRSQVSPRVSGGGVVDKGMN